MHARTPPPNSLYKYEAFSAQSLLNLKKQIIYFGSPLGFNDPYDCAITPNIIEPSDDEALRVRDAYLQRADLPPRARHEFETFSMPQLRAALSRAARAGFRQVVDQFLAKRGVACFSEANDDLLMWSHYGGRYKGFCLEFDASSEPFASKVHPVQYVPALPSLPLATVLLDRDFHPVLELFCTKSLAWSYEREWRAIHHVAGTEFCYSANALTGVYFGPDIDQQSLEVVCLVLAGQNETVKLWRGSRSATDFKVVFELFTYTSFVEAKRRGLRP
jgi:Protein of unknown function (DUF2971)